MPSALWLRSKEEVMAKFSNNAITNAGIDLLALVHTGGELDPVSIVLGSGYIPAGKTVETMTDVVEPVVTLTINKKEKTPDGKVILGGYYSNKDVVTDYYFRELAFFARVRFPQEDGSYTYSDTVLYSYGNAGANADLMAAYSGNTAVERQMDIIVWIGNKTEINLSIEGGVYVTVNVLEQTITNIENRINQVIANVDNNVSQELIALGARLDDLERRVDEHDVEIDALKANDVRIHSRLNETSAQASAVWNAMFNEITGNPAIVDFDTLDGLSLIDGVWNTPLRRLEV